MDVELAGGKIIQEIFQNQITREHIASSARSFRNLEVSPIISMAFYAPKHFLTDLLKATDERGLSRSFMMISLADSGRPKLLLGNICISIFSGSNHCRMSCSHVCASAVEGCVLYLFLAILNLWDLGVSSEFSTEVGFALTVSLKVFLRDFYLHVQK